MNVISESDFVRKQLLQPERLKYYLEHEKQHRLHTASSIIGKEKDKNINYVKLKGLMPFTRYKTHSNTITTEIKPTLREFTKYEKTTLDATFGDNIKFTIPQYGCSVGECLIHVRITNIKSKYPMKFIDRPNYQLLKKVKVSIADFEWEYNPELYNLKNTHEQEKKYMEFDITQTFDSFRIMGLLSDDHSTYKNNHDDLDLYIPIYLGNNKDDTIPLIIEDIIKVEVELTKSENIISFMTTSPNPIKPTVDLKISKFDIYTLHHFIEPTMLNNIFLTWPRTLLTTYDIQHMTISEPSNNVVFNTNDCILDAVYIGFRPMKNLTNPQYWYKNSIVEYKTRDMLVNKKDDVLEWQTVKLPYSRNVISSLELDIDGYEINIDSGLVYDNGWYTYSGLKNIPFTYIDERTVTISYKCDNTLRDIVMIVIFEKLNILDINKEKLYELLTKK